MTDKRHIRPKEEGRDLDDLITEAIEFLRENEPQEGYFMAFSGGKDSIVSLRLLPAVGKALKTTGEKSGGGTMRTHWSVSAMQRTRS